MAIKLIVGLSNPGKRYASTRHNVGSWYVRRMSYRYEFSMHQQSPYGRLGKCDTLCGSVLVLLPNSFMNLNGKAVSAVARFHRILPDEILVAHDELNFSPGCAQIKLGGGHGGHNGVKSVVDALRDARFYRLRIGIGRPVQQTNLSDFVLTRPCLSEKKSIDRIVRFMVEKTQNLLRKTRVRTERFEV